MGKRPLRRDQIDAAVLEVHGLVHDQGWLADRALERALRRDRGLWASERRAVAEAVYGIVRWQGQLDALLGGRPGLAERYAAWLVRFGGVPAADAARRLGVAARARSRRSRARTRGSRRSPNRLDRLSLEASLPRWIVERFVAQLGLDEARAPRPGA